VIPRRVLHPAALLVALDLIGLAIAGYLSYVETGGGVPACGPLRGCEAVALSPYSRIDGVPVAVFGVVLSLTLLALALTWWRTEDGRLLAGHYGLSLLAVMFEVYFTYLEVFVIGAVCVYCAAYGVSLVARFILALWVWRRRNVWTSQPVESHFPARPSVRSP
jgi:uncharacterized membrane protein